MSVNVPVQLRVPQHIGPSSRILVCEFIIDVLIYCYKYLELNVDLWIRVKVCSCS